MFNVLKLVLLLLALGIYQLTYSQTGKSVNVNTSGVTMNFTQNRTNIIESELASNVLQIVNGTNKELNLNLQISFPAGWKFFGKQNIQIHLNPRDSFFIPVRVSPGEGLKGNTNYVVNAFLSTESFTLANSIWYIAVEKISKWQAEVSSNKIYFKAGSTSADFSVTLTNNGNSDELLDVQTLPEKDIHFIDAQGEPINLSSIQVLLKVGTDTTLNYSVRINNSLNTPTDAEPNPDELKKNYRIKLKVINEKAGKGSTRNWSGSIDFFKLSDNTTIEKTASKSFPLTLDLQTYNLLTDNSYATLSILGYKKLKNNSFFNYYYQTDFIKNQLDLNNLTKSYFYIGYFNRLFEIELGDLGANKPGSTLNGRGLKAVINIKNNKIGALYIRRPTFLDQYYTEGYGAFHTFKSKIFTIDNYFQHTNYYYRKIKSDYFTSDLAFRIFKSHSLKIGFGYSTQNNYWIQDSAYTINDMGFKAGYSSSIKKLNYSFQAQISTPSYIPAMGISSFQGMLNYRFNEKYSLAAFALISRFKPAIYSNGHLQTPQVFNNQNNYNLKLNYRNKNYSMVFNPTYYTMNSNFLETKTAGINYEYRLKSKSDLRYFATFFGGFTNFTQYPELQSIFVSNIKLSVMYKMLQANVRYYYGPYYAIEQMLYIENQINPQKFYSTIYYDYWFANNKLKLNINANYIYTTINKRHQFNTRPELFYYSKLGIIFNLYTRYILYADGEQVRTYEKPGTGTITENVPASSISRFEIGAGIKYNFNVPVGPSRNYDVKIIAFRDLNGNGVKDPNEKGIDNMLIRLKMNDSIVAMVNTSAIYGETPASEFELVTNSEGVVTYNNVPLGDYIITAMPLAAMGGWFDGKTFYKNISKNQTFYIPLSKGARLSGGILTEREKYTDNKSLVLNNIRVTAQSINDGKTFSTLTAADGSFTLYVPNGEYVVSINENAVGDKWEFLQNNISLKVEEDFENYNISFYLVEKKRNIRLNNAEKTTKTPLPIQRTTPANKNNSFTDNFVPITTPIEQGKNYVIQLFPNEGPRMHSTNFDTINNVIQLRCIIGENKGYLYISESFEKKNDGKEKLAQVIKLGFKEAQLIQMNFGKTTKVETPTDSNKAKVYTPKTINQITTPEEKSLYRVEIKVSADKLVESNFNELVPDESIIYEIQIDGLWKYSVGDFKTLDEAKDHQKMLKKKYSLNDALVTQYKDSL